MGTRVASPWLTVRGERNTTRVACRASTRNVSMQHRRDALMWLSMATVLPHVGQQDAAVAAGESAYDFSLSYNGEEFPLSYLKNKVTVFVNVASE